MNKSSEPKQDTYTITLNSAQMLVLNSALEMFTRVATAQYEYAFEQYYGSFLEVKACMCGYRHEDIKQVLNLLKKLLTNLNENQQYGIASKDVDDRARIAYDMLQSLRHELWKITTKRNNGIVHASVDAAPPIAFSHEPLIKVKIND